MNPATVVGLIEAIVAAFQRHRTVKNEVIPLIEEAVNIPGLIPEDNAARRKYVIDNLMARGLSESTSRLLLEAGLKLWKKLEAKKAKKAAKKAAKEGK